MTSCLTRGAVATALAAVLSFGTAANAVAGGGDFVGGMLAGGVIGAILGGGLDHRAPPRRVHRPTYDPAVVEYWRTVQSALNEIGIPVGRPDGVAGGRTRRGVGTFQASLGAEPSGQLSPEQYNELMRQANAAVAMGGGTINQPTYQTTLQPYPEQPVAPVAAAAPSGVVAIAVTPPAAVAPVAVPVATTVAAAEPAKPADMTVLNSLLTPDKPLSNDEIDKIEDAASVLGVFVGDAKAVAQKAFEGGVGNCATTGALTECSGKSDAFTDRAIFATTGSGDAESVFYLARSIDFAAPLPKDAITGKLAETLKPVTDDADMTLSTSAVCSRSTAASAAERDQVIGAFARSSVTGAVAMAKLVGDCAAYFHAEIAEKDGQATGLRVYLFDSRALPPAAVAADAKTLPQDLKF